LLKLPGYDNFQGVIVDEMKGAVFDQDDRRLPNSAQEAITTYCTLRASRGAETLYERFDGILKRE
jgi:hypothetical protein